MVFWEVAFVVGGAVVGTEVDIGRPKGIALAPESGVVCWREGLGPELGGLLPPGVGFLGFEGGRLSIAAL